MALAWAAQQQAPSPAIAALLSGGDAAPGCVAAGGGVAVGGGPPAEFTIVLTQCLPDGLGDLVFGESAVRELMALGGVAWIRCYADEEGLKAGERLIAETAALTTFGLACSRSDDLRTAAGAGEGGEKDKRFEELWVGARARFLAPWIFGLSAHEESVLEMAERKRTHFWALSEYGRGMGNIYTYTRGFGAQVPTGWVVDGNGGGVFRSIQRVPRTETDWREKLACRCGVAEAGGAVRLWWFYSRKDNEKKHHFRFLDEEAPGGDSGIRRVAKVVPVGLDGTLAQGNEKTSGEKLAEQLAQAAADPNFKPNIDVQSEEVATGIAGQLSEFVWGILNDPGYTKGSAVGDGAVDIVVAPNVFTERREASRDGCFVVSVEQLDLVGPRGPMGEVPLGSRRLFVCGTRVPRREMRSFLEQCEERVFTTGDQSLAEAMFMDKLPCIRPDAKVQQWQVALIAKAAKMLDAVPDLGKEIQRLVTEPAMQEKARRLSKENSDAVERSIMAQLGGLRPEAWTATQQVLARAGMLS